ncbi:MAG: lysylphosphatidylglycerol synthase domain-containing protein [Solirubrobacteraceae bacterium]
MSLEPQLLADGCVEADEAGLRFSSFRRKIALSALGALLVAGVLAFVLAGHSQQFSVALRTAPISLLAVAVLLQIVALLARSEAWNVCVRAAGGTAGRRILFRAAALGYVASILNGSFGMAVRIASLRRSAPDTTPRVPALMAAEVPIITVELALVAIFSFTLVAPLGVPWWVPGIIIGLTAGVVAGLRCVSQRHQAGLWAGLTILRIPGRARLITFAVLAVCAQVLRNWLMLRAIGVNVSVFDAMALLIVMFTVGQLPIGPSTGPAAAVLILGASGVAATAAAGVLLTVTGIVGTLCYAAWAATDRIAAGRLVASRSAVVSPTAVRPTST